MTWNRHAGSSMRRESRGGLGRRLWPELICRGQRRMVWLRIHRTKRRIEALMTLVDASAIRKEHEHVGSVDRDKLESNPSVDLWVGC